MKCRGCSFIEAVKLVAGVLSLDSSTTNTRNYRLAQIPKKFDLNAAAFRLEMAALDRRLRSKAVLQAVADFNGEGLSDTDRDRLLNAVAAAYDDRKHAEHLEQTADRFRWRAFQEKEARHVAA
jgi:hypothetical protein